MKKMLSTRFGLSMFILLFTVFILFIWIQRETYIFPSLRRNIYSFISTIIAVFPFKINRKEFLHYKEFKVKDFYLVFLLSDSFFLLIWFATSFFLL